MLTQTHTRTMYRFLAALAVLGWQSASAVEVSWLKRPGTGLHISGDADGRLWVVGTERLGPKGYRIFRWKGTDWDTQDLNWPGRTIAVAGEKVWVLDEANDLMYYGQFGFPLFQKARDFAVANNIGWIIGMDKQAGGYGVYYQGSGGWVSANRGGVRIAVDKAGNAWVVNEAAEVFMYNITTNTWEHKKGQKARSVHTGALSGKVWITGIDPIAGGYPIYQWDATKQVWESYGTYGAVEMTEAAGVTWIVQSDGSLYSMVPQGQPSPPGAPAAPADTNLVWPAPTPQQTAPLVISQSGKNLCSSTSGTTCGNTKADYVGKYTLNTHCDSGFYDPIHGGTCWKCPDDDGRGAWIRSLDSIEKETACWRSPKEATGPANKVKSPAWAWDCPAGSFWDGYSPDGAGGSCWKCPDNLPRRTAAAVWANNACASSLNETSSATFLTFNGCPTPDATTMNLPGKRQPGKPFLDIAAGWNQQSASAGCFACPIVDESGNFVITDRNANPVYDAESNAGCTIKMKWQPATFHEPGLAYMQGVKEVIWEQRLFDDLRLTGFLFDLAEAKGYANDSADAKEWVTARWQEIATAPYNSDTIRTFMFAYLKTALKKPASERTAAEKTLIDSFSHYIRNRRVYLAEQALAMYDAWKLWDETFRAQTGQNRSLSNLFYYGSVPLDFHGTLNGLMTVGASGGGVLAAMALGNHFGNIIGWTHTAESGASMIQVHERTLNGMFENLKLLKSTTGLTAISGAAIIQVASAILTSIAIEQFVAIETARPKLEAALAKARQTVDLNAVLSEDNGADTMYLYWARAMDTYDHEDPQVATLAAVAAARAAQSGYAKPLKTMIPKEEQVTDRLSSGASSGFLNQGEKLVSANGKYSVEMQSDGDLVIYTATRTPIWRTNTKGKGTGPYKLAMQADSNLVIYAASGPTWASGVRRRTAPYMLLMQDDANLVVYDNNMQAIWASGTHR